MVRLNGMLSSAYRAVVYLGTKCYENHPNEELPKCDGEKPVLFLPAAIYLHSASLNLR